MAAVVERERSAFNDDMVWVVRHLRAMRQESVSALAVIAEQLDLPEIIPAPYSDALRDIADNERWVSIRHFIEAFVSWEDGWATVLLGVSVQAQTVLRAGEQASVVADRMAIKLVPEAHTAQERAVRELVRERSYEESLRARLASHVPRLVLRTSSAYATLARVAGQ